MKIDEETYEIIEWLAKVADTNGYDKQECVNIMKLLHTLITRE